MLAVELGRHLGIVEALHVTEMPADDAVAVACMTTSSCTRVSA